MIGFLLQIKFIILISISLLHFPDHVLTAKCTFLSHWSTIDFLMALHNSEWMQSFILINIFELLCSGINLQNWF